MSPTPVIYDTDGGVDDCSALWYGLVSPEIDIVGVTSVRGVVSAQQAAANMAKILVAADRTDIPYAVGADEPVGPRPEFPEAALMHGGDGLGDAGPPDVDLAPTGETGAELIVRLAREHPGELTIVAVGPFTNVALALRLEPALPDLVDDLVIMGGAARPPGNATPLGEFNVVFDPVASNEMVLGGWKKPPLMVGLDVTMSATMGDAEFDAMNERKTPQARFMADPFVLYRELSAIETGDGSCPSHDTLTMMAVEQPTIVSASELPLVVDTGGDAAFGMTVVDFRAEWLASGMVPEEFMEMARAQFYSGKATWRIALEVDVERFRSSIRRFYSGS